MPVHSAWDIGVGDSTAIWFYQEAVKEYDRRLSEPRLQTIVTRVLPMVRYCDEAMWTVMVMMDPADPSRRAFSRPK